MNRAGMVFVGMITALVVGCGRGGSGEVQSKSNPLALVRTAVVQQQALVKTGSYTGSIEPVKTARMASPAEGPVVHCAVREGDQVVAGDLLAQVGRRNIVTAALAAAQEELSRQQAEYRRVATLVKSGSLAGEELDGVRSEVKKAEAQVAAMETGAADYEIHAPWPGLVSKVWIAEGDYVVPRAPLVEMYDPASLVVRFAVPEQHALAVRRGAQISVSLDAYPGRKLTAEVTRIFAELERTTRTVTVEAELKENLALLSGMFARVEVPVSRLDQAVVIPQSALRLLPNGAAMVWRLQDGAVNPVQVSVLLEVDGKMAINGELQLGDVIVTRGNESLKAGAKVQVEPLKKTGQGK